MSLPLRVPQFESFLQSLRPDAPVGREGWREWIVIPEEQVSLGDRLARLPAVRIFYSEGTDLSLTALLQKVSEELRRYHHPSSTEMAGIVLAFFANAQRSDGPAVPQFNEVFSRITSADLNQYFLFSIPSPPRYRFKVGPFSIGPFAPDRLAYQCRKAGSDYYDRYESLLRKSLLAVERDPFAVRVIPWHKLTCPDGAWSLNSTTPDEIRFRLWDTYFSHLSGIYFESFFERLNLAQELGMALGSGWFDALKLTELIGTHRVSVYMNIGCENKGFVSPAQLGTIAINLGGAHLGIPATEKVLKEHFGLTNLTDCEIHQMICSFSHFLALSAKHHHDGRDAEGFLHSVIALDLLLGERLESTKSVAKRSAVLCHRPLRTSFVNTVRECEMIYDARSRYVHAGQIPDKILWDLTTRVCREIAFCLLRLQRNQESRVAGFRDKWVREIDFVAASFESGRSPSAEDLASIGVAFEGEYGLGDFEQALQNTPWLHGLL